MPNFKLSNDIRTHIKDRAQFFADCMLEFAQADFPMDVHQVQVSVMEPHLIQACRELEQSDVHTIVRHDRIRMVFLREQFPGLIRSASVVMDLPDRVFVTRATNYGVRTVNFQDPDSSANYIIPNNTGLASCDRRAVAEWVNRAVRAKRLHELTINSVDYIMDHAEHSRTTAHLHYLWPTLTKLVDPKSSDDIRRYVARFSHLPRYKKPYLPHPLLRDRYKRIMEAADVVLLKGMNLPEFETDYEQVRAQVEQWEEREGDPQFPVEVRL